MQKESGPCLSSEIKWWNVAARGSAVSVCLDGRPRVGIFDNASCVGGGAVGRSGLRSQQTFWVESFVGRPQE